MDAVKFIKERQRMCNYFSPSCEGCLIAEMRPVVSECCLWTFDNSEEAVQLVEEWSAAHPRKTRQSVFLEQWPDAAIGREELLMVCPKNLNVNFSCIDESTDTRSFKACPNCRREFWMQEVE